MIRKSLVAAVVAAWAAMPGLVNATAVTDRPTGVEMAMDAVLARPLLLVSTVVGTGLFVVSLPFSALGGNVEEAGSTLVATPFKATFVRCLGCTLKNMDDERVEY